MTGCSLEKSSGFNVCKVMFNILIKEGGVIPEGRLPMYNFLSVFCAVGNKAKDWTKYGLEYKENWESVIIGLRIIWGIKVAFWLSCGFIKLLFDWDKLLFW